MTPPAAVLWSTDLFDRESPPHRDGEFDALPRPGEERQHAWTVEVRGAEPFTLRLPHVGEDWWPMALVSPDSAGARALQDALLEAGFWLAPPAPR